MELTILMPCPYEALTIETCIRKAQTYLAQCGIGSTGDPPTDVGRRAERHWA